MIVIALFTICALYFFYLKKWAESLISRERNFGSPSPRATLAHSPTVSIIVCLLWGTLLLLGVCWGFSPGNLADQLTIHGENAEIGLLVVSCLAIGFSYSAIYRIGEIRGVMRMKDTVLFQRYIRTRDNG